MIRCCALLLLAACGRGSESESRLVGDDELARLEADLMAVVRSNADRSCPRPVLRGTPAPGRADADLLTIMEPSRELASCFDPLGAESFRSALATCPEGTDEPRCEPRSLDDPASRTPEITALEARCAAVEAAVTRATAHEDACSPYLTGRRAQKKLLPMIRASKAVALRARALARGGDPAAALRLVLDGLRFGQDMSRGGASLILAMTTVASARMLLPVAELLLGTRADLTPEALDELAAEIDVLLASTPHFSEILGGEGIDTTLYMTVPLVKPRDWVPPGGWPEGYGPGAETSSGKRLTDDPRDDGAIAWLALNEKTRAEREACPPTASLRSCIEAIIRLEHRWSSAATKLPAADLTPRTSKRARELFRWRTVAVLLGISSYSTNYLRRWSATLAQLGALRLHVEARRIAAASGSCPTVADFDRPPLVALRSPPGLGDRLEIEGLDVMAPAWTIKEQRRPSVVWRIACPPHSP